MPGYKKETASQIKKTKPKESNEEKKKPAVT